MINPFIHRRMKERLPHRNDMQAVANAAECDDLKLIVTCGHEGSRVLYSCIVRGTLDQCNWLISAGSIGPAYCTIDPNVGDELPVGFIRQLKLSWATDHSIDVQITCNAGSTFCPYFAGPDQFVNSYQDRKINFYSILLQSSTSAVSQAPAGNSIGPGS